MIQLGLVHDGWIQIKTNDWNIPESDLAWSEKNAGILLTIALVLFFLDLNDWNSSLKGLWK